VVPTRGRDMYSGCGWTGDILALGRDEDGADSDEGLLSAVSITNGRNSSSKSNS